MFSEVITIMFHSVGLRSYNWAYPHISDFLESFNKKMLILNKQGYETYFTTNILEANEAKRGLLLTFDDGYLDNWVHVFPVLKKYRLKATIFINPEFIDPRPIIRTQAEPGSVSDIDHCAKDCCAGFLSWPEMREMEQSGLVDVQSHALTHTWHFNGPKIIDFWYPGIATKANPQSPIWMLWNEYPEIKPYYLTKSAEYETKFSYGTPIYEHGNALTTRRYFPNDSIKNLLCSYIADNGGRDFFRQVDWHQKIQNVLLDYNNTLNSDKLSGIYETKIEYLSRIKNELVESKRIIEQNLNKEIKTICWPAGGVTEEVLKLAREVGYKYFTLPSKWKKQDAPKICNGMIPRIGSLINISVKGINLGEPTGLEFKWYLKAHQGKKMYKLLARVSQLFRLMLKVTGK